MLPLAAQLDITLSALYQTGCLHFYAGGALGFDTLAAERTLLLRRAHPDIALHLLLPCRDQSRTWSEEDVWHYEMLLSQCDSYHFISEQYSESAMLLRNRALVEHADVCVAYMLRENSGTGHTVRAAKQAGLPVLNLADRRYP